MKRREVLKLERAYETVIEDLSFKLSHIPTLDLLERRYTEIRTGPLGTNKIHPTGDALLPASEALPVFSGEEMGAANVDDVAPISLEPKP